ncbi:MAG: LLM class flavin-dependent oxidoreductase [Anaerolineaceae bacterium]
MVQIGINIIPVMPVEEIIQLIKAAEEIGYDYCLLADEGLTADVYAILAIAARETKHIKIGPVTNGYTRHPAVTAAAMATLNELAKGRTVLVMVAGGSVVLDTFGIKREVPLTVVRETMEICRRLWSGEKVNWQGSRFTLANAQLEMGRQDIPIWIAGRGEKILELAGKEADGVLLMVKPDIGPALEIIDRYENKPLRIYMDRIAYTESMINDATRIFPYVLKDTPERQLRGFLSEAEILQIRNAESEGGAEAVGKIITSEMIKRYKVAGTPQECHQMIDEMVKTQRLDAFILNITTAGLDKNIQMLKDVKSIIEGSAL